MSPARVRLWALSTCPWCRKTKQWFSANGVDFEFVDVDLLPDAEYDVVVADVQRLSGVRSFPIVQIGDVVIVGYAPDKYARALGIGA
jgi:glutaredoxin